jgi:hypothetical protein
VLGSRGWRASCARFACLRCVNGAWNGVWDWVWEVFSFFPCFSLLSCFLLFPGCAFEFAGVLVWTVVLYVLVVLATGVCI